MSATIASLENELVSLIKSIPEFSNSGFSVFSLDDLETRSTGSQGTYAVAGISYNGVTPVGDGGDPKFKTTAARVLDIEFLIAIGVQGGYTGQEDTKPTAYSLLEKIRGKILGYQNVNSRPWRLVDEKPERGFSGDGVLFYTQIWQTTIVVVGPSTTL